MGIKNIFYAVKVGKTPGIYATWEECKAQIEGFKKAEYQPFFSRDAAEKWFNSIVPVQLTRNDKIKDSSLSMINLSDNVKASILKPASEEQTKVLEALENYNVKVQAVAGSGKTTTALHIAKKFKDKQILLLTYNRKLMDETKLKKEKLGIDNLEVRTFHSFGKKFFKENCYDDEGIHNIIKNNLQPKININFDLILIDESQDLTPLLYEFTCRIISLNKQDFKLCILGDKNQSIYEYNFADSRYLEKAELLFKFNKRDWKECNLSESYRVNKETTDFINNVFYNKIIMKSNIKKPEAVEYIVCNSFGDKDLTKKVIEAVEKYGAENVFILAYSVKSKSSPAKKLANNLSSQGILVYTPNNDEEKLDQEELKNKVVFSSFHQAKGLERKVVFVLGFDIAFFKYYAKEQNPLLPNNILYVALSRALEKLFIVHHYENGPLPFLQKDRIKDFAKFSIYGGETIEAKFNEAFKKEFKGLEVTEASPTISVTKLIKNLNSKIITAVKDKIKNTILINNDQGLFTTIRNTLELKSKKGIQYRENVSSITGQAALIYYQKQITPSGNIIAPLQILDSQIKNNFEYLKKELPVLIKHADFITKLINQDKWIAQDILYLSAIWNTYLEMYSVKLTQIPEEKFNWISDAEFNKITKLIDDQVGKNLIFEKKFSVQGDDKQNKELLGKELVGFVDCIDLDQNAVFEFKFVNEIKPEHFLQVVLYKYLIENSPEYKGKNFRYFLYNIKKNQKYEIEISDDDLIEIVGDLFQNKFNSKINWSDKEFIENANLIMKKYLESSEENWIKTQLVTRYKDYFENSIICKTCHQLLDENNKMEIILNNISLTDEVCAQCYNNLN
ncbi:hypothetical protein SSYRP_v1c01140 [Spiroplasma syrphidicola EA-1]|uniref:Ribonuclease H n=1 Tax=Spiroplasma syrphidicola EA-1 TaxID=1276229 RepID=R4UHV4_9MOLU|nr:viroplasmin family protein [Spiroplasma syrphidicola]AGM25710.1 hypothetical protein SSYRP_v1c01140 [Spiroplasma syrphidicola EA-1]